MMRRVRNSPRIALRYRAWRRAANRRLADRVRGQRGIALALTLVLITLMTALVVDANDRAHQKLLQAARHRDGAQAYYLANTGKNLYLLLLGFGTQLKNMAGGYAETIESQLGVDLSQALWQSLPFIDSGLLRMVMSGANVGMDEEELQAAIGSGAIDPSALSERQQEKLEESHLMESERRHDFLEFQGDFRSEILQDEGGFNVNWLVTMAGAAGTPLEQQPAARALLGLFQRPAYRDFFRDELKMEPVELVANLKDWADSDTEGSGPYGGYEDKLYEDAEIPYKAKNAPFLTHRELQLVYGMTDRAYGLFGPALKVWGRQLNINAAGRDTVAGVLKAFVQGVYTDEQIDTALQRIDTELHPLWFGKWQYRRNGVNQFLQEFERMMEARPPTSLWRDGVTGKRQLASLLTTTSEFFTIRSTGFVNESERTIEVSLRFRQGSNQFTYLQWKEF